MKPVMRVFRRFSGSFCLLLLFSHTLPGSACPARHSFLRRFRVCANPGIF